LIINFIRTFIYFFSKPYIDYW